MSASGPGDGGWHQPWSADMMAGMAVQWATSKDVAERANVSRAAVSAVLSGAGGSIRVSESTRKRILQAAAELNYSPNHAARNLRKRRSGTIAFALPSFSDGLYERTIPRQLSHHLMQSVVARGHRLVEMALPASPAGSGAASPDLIREHQVDGVVIGWPDSPEQVEDIAGLGVPVVQVMKPQAAAGTTTITVNPEVGVTSAVEHLVGLGHTRIAYLGARGQHPVETTRLRCFQDAMAAQNQDCSSDLIALASAYSLQEGLELTRGLLTLDDPPTAFIAGDGLVLGALRTLYDARLHVPTDVSIVGFDDELAASLYPALSSIRQPISEVAELAVTTIEHAATNPANSTPPDIVLPTSFSIRESTGPRVKQ